jgi:hypothetical protein
MMQTLPDIVSPAPWQGALTRFSAPLLPNPLNEQPWPLEAIQTILNSFRQGNKQPVGGRWRVDETYIKIKDEWKYLSSGGG